MKRNPCSHKSRNFPVAVVTKLIISQGMSQISGKTDICVSKTEKKEIVIDWLFVVFRYPVVAMGVICWVEEVVSDPAYFQRMTDTTPLHLILLDEVNVIVL